MIKKIQGRPIRLWGHESMKEGKKSKPKYGHELPDFELSSNDLPELKDWPVGKKYTMEVEVELTGNREQNTGDMETTIGYDNDDENSNGEKVYIARFKITGVGVKGEGGEQKEVPVKEEKSKKLTFEKGSKNPNEYAK